MLFFVSFGFLIFLSSVSNGADAERCGNSGGCAAGEEDGLQRASGETQQLMTMLEEVKRKEDAQTVADAKVESADHRQRRDQDHKEKKKKNKNKKKKEELLLPVWAIVLITLSSFLVLLCFCLCCCAMAQMHEEDNRRGYKGRKHSAKEYIIVLMPGKREQMYRDYEQRQTRDAGQPNQGQLQQQQQQQKPVSEPNQGTPLITPPAPAPAAPAPAPEDPAPAPTVAADPATAAADPAAAAPAAAPKPRAGGQGLKKK